MYSNFSSNLNNNSSPKQSSLTFITISAVIFIIAVFATIYYTRSMNDEMMMPGGWKMSMMWMRMTGETWLSSTISFMLMWLAMMIVMMMPSALPAFLKTTMASDVLYGIRLFCYMDACRFSCLFIGNNH